MTVEVRPRGIAVVGLGNHAEKRVLPALVSRASCRLVGLYSRDLSRSTSLRRRFGGKAFPGIEDIFSDSEVDTVYLAGLPSTRFEWIRTVLAHGRHVWCEKPICPSTEDFLSLYALAQERQLCLFEAFTFCYHRQQAKLRELASEHHVGKIVSLTARFGYPHLSSTDFRYSKAQGGGALLDAGVYPIAATLDLLGANPELVSSYLYSANFEVDISGAALLSYSTGQTAHLEWGMGRCYRNEIEIWGERGRLRTERAFAKPSDLATKIDFTDTNGRVETHCIEPMDHFETMLDQFSCASDSPPERANLNLRALDQFRLLKQIAEGGNSRLM